MTDILTRYKWKKVHAPKTWNPRAIGAELAGFYGGRTMRTGAFGQYEVILVHVPTDGSYMISGCKLMQLIDAAMIDTGDPVRVVWQGYQKLATGTSEERSMKLFEVYVAEGDPIEASELPRVSGGLVDPGAFGPQ